MGTPLPGVTRAPALRQARASPIGYTALLSLVACPINPGSPLQPAAVIRILKPNVTSLGYALFLAINAAGVWGGVFPFLPLEFQTPEIVFWFFLAQSLVFSASYFASAFGVYFLPGPRGASWSCWPPRLTSLAGVASLRPSTWTPGPFRSWW